jgi:hypothetical protein
VKAVRRLEQKSHPEITPNLGFAKGHPLMKCLQLSQGSGMIARKAVVDLKKIVMDFLEGWIISTYFHSKEKKRGEYKK